MVNDKNLIIIDGYGFLFRAFYSMPPLTTPNNSPIGAIYGFCSMLLRVINEMQFTHIVVALDSGAKTFRNDIFPDYKANRSAPPDDLIPQFPIIREAIETFGIKALEVVGFEADDIIATLTKQAKNQGFKVTIISTDKDLMQLIDDGLVTMYDGIKNNNIGEKEVFDKFGVKPKQIRDILSLIGDSSDNIPGVRGIGPKGAAELISQFHSLENLLANIDMVPKPKHREYLRNDLEIAMLSHKLVTLAEDVSLDVSIDDLISKKPNRETVTNFFNELGFKTLLSRVKFDINDTKISTPSPIKADILEIKTILELSDFIAKAKNNGRIAIYLEKENPKSNLVLSIGLAYNEDKACIIATNEQESLLFPAAINSNDIKQLLRKTILDDSIVVIGHDIKFILHFLFDEANDKVKGNNLEDIMLMSYVLDNGRLEHDYSSLLKNHLEIEHPENNASLLLKIHDILKPRLISEKVLTIYKNIENPLSTVLFRIEKEGIKISKKGLTDLYQYFNQHIAQLEQAIYQIAGHSFNIGSPKQLSELLFDTLGYKSNEKTSKTKSNSTSAEVLEELAENGVEIASLILKWRQYSKLNSTYTANLVNHADKNDRIHTNFRMCVTSTGRLSSTEPNLQNIPIRTEEGKKIRSNFIAGNDKILISADYSQIELRLLASMANVTSLIDAFNHNIDIHTKTAAEIFNIPLNEITPELRHKAKAINFGIIYGISSFGLATGLNIAKSEAKAFIDLYFQRYPEIKSYMDSTIEFARKNGYVSTLFGRKCFIKGINDKNFSIRGLSERAAINAPIQGSQADIIKKAMIKIDQEIQNQNLTSKVILQIHDELIIETSISQQDIISKIVKDEMESVVKLSVPTIVDISYGDNWGAL